MTYSKNPTNNLVSNQQRKGTSTLLHIKNIKSIKGIKSKSMEFRKIKSNFKKE